ncbi:HflK protein [Anaerobacillus alkalidiazotrophicus]|uniref:Protein HflK n=1 Tax=Anaerobacillus alkalidiazotrophicus TaxID=472963 RepID=A0A1S2M566_9BACI|nr:FtsH protease activity modulator HflK [Anaerobacillus alkalidiazotrophicus]OIJ18277.1 HflK protein [Anaerobacillus alkalidiazotrophicus]OIJ19756.1 HflK protein [Anaerobacillus alkalidiazotrophicus]
MVTMKQIIVGFFSLVGIAILALFLVTGWYIVDESEQAALITFGKVDDHITEPGLKFKLPWPIQRVEILSRGTFTTTVGYDERDGEVIEYRDEAKMITGDENILLADLVVQWRITNPEKFLFNSNDPEQILFSATSASLRGIIGSSRIDDALTDQRPEIEAQVWDYLVALIEDYDIGISVMDVKLQDVELPNDEVRSAFMEVTDAREERLTKINEANKYRNQKINEAKGEQDAIISRAEGTRTERLERARGDVARFEALYNEYLISPEVTRSRLVIETLERVLPSTEIYIMDESSDTVKYLPIRSLERNPSTATTASEGSGN